MVRISITKCFNWNKGITARLLSRPNGNKYFQVIHRSWNIIRLEVFGPVVGEVKAIFLQVVPVYIALIRMSSPLKSHTAVYVERKLRFEFVYKFARDAVRSDILHAPEDLTGWDNAEAHHEKLFEG